MRNKVFNKYYKENFKSLRDAAKKLKYSRSSICLWLNGKAMPSPEAMQAVYKASNKKVAPQTWFGA